MTTDEIRRALAITEQWSLHPSQQLHQVAFDPSTGYEATLRALLEARELLKGAFGLMQVHGLDEWCAKVRAFLAEGESK